MSEVDKMKKMVDNQEKLRKEADERINQAIIKVDLVRKEKRAESNRRQ